MEKIVLVNPYIGKFPVYFSAFLRSCAANPSIDWLILADCEYDGEIPGNVKFKKTSLTEITGLIEKKLGFRVTISSPIKICDFRPAFGLIFEDLIKDYDFWGHCDFDLVFGNLRKYFSDEVLTKYNKVFVCGHLSLYRNIDEMNRLFSKDAPNVSHRAIFNAPNHCWFEEYGGFKQIMDHHGVEYLEGLKQIADIGPASFKMKQFHVQNYPIQAYLWERGSTFRVFFNDGKIQKEEFAYVHFQKRKMKKPGFDMADCEAFWIEPNGYAPATSDEITREDLRNHNRTDFVYDVVWRVKNFRQTKIGRILRM